MRVHGVGHGAYRCKGPGQRGPLLRRSPVTRQGELCAPYMLIVRLDQISVSRVWLIVVEGVVLKNIFRNFPSIIQEQ